MPEIQNTEEAEPNLLCNASSHREGDNDNMRYKSPLLTPEQFINSALFLQEHRVDCEMQPPLRQETCACLQSIIDHSNSTIQKTLTFSKLKQGRNFDRENSCPTAMKTRVQNWESIHIHTPKNLLCAPVWSGLPEPAWKAAFLERQLSFLCFAITLISS